jgi:hypothetical protein
MKLADAKLGDRVKMFVDQNGQGKWVIVGEPMVFCVEATVIALGSDDDDVLLGWKKEESNDRDDNAFDLTALIQMIALGTMPSVKKTHQTIHNYAWAVWAPKSLMCLPCETAPTQVGCHCTSCGTHNEYAEYKPNFVCGSCRAWRNFAS